MKAAGGEAHALGRLTDQRRPVGVGARDVRDQRRRTGRVGGGIRQTARGVARALEGAGGRHARGRLAGALGRRRQDQVGGRDRRHLDAQVDAVEQRSGDPRLVLRHAARVRPAPAGVARFESLAAAARVHRRDQLEARRVGDPVVGPGDHHRPGFHRLAQAVEHLRGEFGQLVQEQHPAMGEGDLPGPGAEPATHERRHRGGMVRLPERAAAGEGAALQRARHRLDHGDVEQLARRERRQDRRQTGREHGFARARRTVHQQVVAAGRRDLEGALGTLLPPDVGEVRKRPGRRGDGGLRPRHDLAALEMVGELDQRARREHVEVAPGPGRLRSGGGRADEPEPPGTGRHGGRQHAADRRDAAVEGEFAEDAVAGERVGRDRADRRHDAQRDRQVEVRAFLGKIRRSEIHRDALGGQCQSGGDQRAADPLARFRHRLVGQTDDGEDHGARDDLDLHVHRPRLDALEGHGGDAGDHRCQVLAAAFRYGPDVRQIRERLKGIAAVELRCRRPVHSRTQWPDRRQPCA